jgi:hypothetical protein
MRLENTLLRNIQYSLYQMLRKVQFVGKFRMLPVASTKQSIFIYVFNGKYYTMVRIYLRNMKNLLLLHALYLLAVRLEWTWFYFALAITCIL